MRHCIAGDRLRFLKYEFWRLLGDDGEDLNYTDNALEMYDLCDELLVCDDPMPPDEVEDALRGYLEEYFEYPLELKTYGEAAKALRSILKEIISQGDLEGSDQNEEI